MRFDFRAENTSRAKTKTVARLRKASVRESRSIKAVDRASAWSLVPEDADKQAGCSVPTMVLSETFRLSLFLVVREGIGFLDRLGAPCTRLTGLRILTLEPERLENQQAILRNESGMDSRQTLKLLARFPPVLRRRYRRPLGVGLLEVDLAGLALPDVTGAGGGDTASALKMSSITFHSPPGCFFHTVTYLPFSVIGSPAALFTVI